MSHEDKIWLIEAGDVLETPRPQQELPATPRPAPHPRPRTAAVVEPREPRRVVREQARPQTLHIAPLLVLTWLLGPLAVLLTPEGRRERTWAGLGVVAAVAAAILTLVPFARFHQGLAGSAPLVWMPLAFIATLQEMADSDPRSMSPDLVTIPRHSRGMVTADARIAA